MHADAASASAIIRQSDELELGEATAPPRGFDEMCQRKPVLCSELGSSSWYLPGDGPASLQPDTGQALSASGDSLAAKADLRLLSQVNRLVNDSVAQRSDMALYGLGEWWTRSGLGTGAAGDCEDVAIEKRLQLIDSGVPPERLAFAVVYSRRAGLHVLLLARTAAGVMVLDSRTNRIVPWTHAPYSWIAIQGWS